MHTRRAVLDAPSAQTPQDDERLVAMANEVASLRDELAKANDALANLRARYHQLLEELHLLKRRLVVAKAERLDDVADAQLAFDKLLAETQAIKKVLDDTPSDEPQEAAPAPGDKPRGRTRNVPDGPARSIQVRLARGARRAAGPAARRKGRAHRGRGDLARRLRAWGIPAPGRRAHRVQEARAKRAPSDRWQDRRADRGCADGAGLSFRHRADAQGDRAARHPRTVHDRPRTRHQVRPGRSLLSLRATVRTRRLCARSRHDVQVRRARRRDPRLHRRGGAQGGHRHRVLLVHSATGVAIQPTPLQEGKRQPCRKGHFFVTLADKDHIFFDFQPKHTSLAVWQMFKGFSGYVQADAHVIYDALFKGIPPDGADDKPGECGPPPIEVGCFSHARRKYWEAAVCKHPLGLQGVRLIDAIFDADRPLAKLAPLQRKAQRDQTVRPLVDAFFTWARAEHEKRPERGLVASALGYSVRHELALRRFLDDGRLRMENNSAERELRAVAVGRRAWLFYGSDDHAGAAGNILSLIASCKLHGLDPELYLAEIIRIVPYWPRDRYLELAPKYWPATRARLSPKELQLPLGHITVPPPSKEQPSSD